MATSTGYDYGVRQGLNQKGVTNDRISYDPNKGVMVDGQNFYKPEKVYQGTAFTNQQNFNQAWDNYNKNMQQAANNTANTTQQQPYSYNPYANNNMIQNNPYSSQADQIIQQLLDYGKNQQAFDPYSTSSYQAAQAQAQRAAGQNTRAAQEAYGSAGFGRSTALGERVAGINNDATEYLMTQVLPQIEAQEAARRQQEYNNQVTALQQLLGQQSRADNLVQQDFDNRVTKGQLTGDFMDPEATAIIDQILALKQQAEKPGLANTDVKALSAQADQYRNRLSALGYDPALFGANVNAQTAGGNRGAATRTLAGQEFDLNRQIDQRNFDYQLGRDERADFESDRNYGVTMAQLTGFLPDGTPTSAQQQQELSNLWMVAQQTGTIPNELADLYNIPRGTRTQDAIAQAAQIAISQQNANTSATSAANSANNAAFGRLMDIWQSTGVAPAGLENYGVSAGTPYAGGSGGSTAGVVSDLTIPRNASTMETWIVNNIPGGIKTQGPPPPNQLEWIETQLLNNPNLSEKDLIKLYNRFGIPLPE